MGDHTPPTKPGVTPFRRAINFVRWMIHRFGRGLAEIWALLSMPLEAFRPRHLRSSVARTRHDLKSGTHLFTTTSVHTLRSVLFLIVWSPIFVVRFVASTPRRTWMFVRTSSWRRLAFTGLGLLGMATVAAVAWHARAKVRAEDESRLVYQKLEGHFQTYDYGGVKGDLERLAALAPNDTDISARLAALNEGSAPPDDPKLAKLLIGVHRGHGRFEEAKREALKYNAHHPGDWMALIILAENSLRSGDRVGATKWISQLPDPRQSGEHLSPWICIQAARIFQELGEKKRLDDLIDIVCRDHLPVLPEAALNSFEPVVRMQFIELYSLALRKIVSRQDLLQYWPRVQELAQSIATSPKSDSTLLVSLGIQQELQLEAHIRDMERNKIIDSERAKQMKTDVEGRLKLIWDRARTIDSKNPYSYLGAAMQMARVNNLRGAVAQLDAGIKEAGPDSELIEKKAELLRQLNPRESLAFLNGRIQGKPQTPSMCRLLALAALECDEPQIARDAIKQAEVLQPGSAWIAVLEAEVELHAHQPAAAAEALNRVRDRVSYDQNAAGLFVRALAESGQGPAAEQFLNEVIARQDDSSVIVLAGCDELRKANLVDHAINVLRRLISSDQLNFGARIVLADCLLQRAEASPTGWNSADLTEALDAYRSGRSKFPKNLYYANNVAWLELTAVHSPGLAYDSALPLRSAANLPPDMLQTLAAACAFGGNYSEAQTALLKMRGDTPRASTSAIWALTYQGLNLPDKAQEAMAKAKSLPRGTPLEGELIKRAEERIGVLRRINAR
ncbi:MAG: tetratricopeptide repeat protein [Gemmataceae bacterium]